MGRQKERYQIIQMIAKSEIKTIWLVYHSIEQVYFVMKELPETRNIGIYKQLMENPHRYMPTIYETFLEDGYFYVIESFVNGNTLEYNMRAHALDETLAIQYISQLCEVLHHLHRLQPPLIHRDIKAENVLIFENHVMLIDFEIARIFNKEANKDTQVLGSVGYAAPEQYGFNQSDERTDIYAVGVLMNYVLCGKHPKDGIAQGKYNKIIAKCIAIDPKDRYQKVELLQKMIHNKNLSLQLLLTSWIPGFGTGPLRNCLVVMIYILWGMLCLSADFKDDADVTIGHPVLFCMQLAIFFLPITWIAVGSNYKNVYKYLPGIKNAETFLEIVFLMGYVTVFSFMEVLFFVIFSTLL